MLQIFFIFILDNSILCKLQVLKVVLIILKVAWSGISLVFFIRMLRTYYLVFVLVIKQILSRLLLYKVDSNLSLKN